MKTISNIATAAILIIFVWSVASGLKPFWNKYCLEKEIETAAIYGTKNSVADIRAYLERKMREKGYAFQGDDFSIERDEHNNVSLSISYRDEIQVLGLTLKRLDITVEGRASDIKAYY